MGAASAVLLLVFKDTILGFVASIQVATNDMVRIGDWISMEKYGADGDVIEINLATVKIRNWDKTITTIPTYYLISDSFKNWRGMQDSGGRRIKRSIYIKISSINHLSQDDIKKLVEIDLLRPYLLKRSAEIEVYNKENNINRSVIVNGYNLTNIGVFRRYINEYLAAHPGIHKGMTMMVRQLSPSITGIPVEIYAFSDDTKWLVYEELMSDIFDHLLASVKHFGLEVFEMPAADDVRAIHMYNTAVNNTA
jgi:miniconductance mechanosensitive channel